MIVALARDLWTKFDDRGAIEIACVPFVRIDMDLEFCIGIFAD
jgi:hypothetical protein